jgi:hypothetical protein
MEMEKYSGHAMLHALRNYLLNLGMSEIHKEIDWILTGVWRLDLHQTQVGLLMKYDCQQPFYR